MRRQVQSVRRLERNVSCEADQSTTMAFDEAGQRADATRFIVARSLSLDRQFTAEWLRRMAAHRAFESATGHRGTQWNRAPLIHQHHPDVDVLPPEPEMVQSSDDDTFLLAAGYCDALRLAFIVVDVLLVSYHVTRTCASAHALLTVGLRERVTARVADVASLLSGRAPAVVMPTSSAGELARSVSMGGYDGDQPSLTVNVSLSNHLDTTAPPSSTWSNHSAVNLRPCSPQQTSCNPADRQSLPLKAKHRFISLRLCHHQSLFERKTDLIAECRYWFGLLEMETLIAKRKQRFMAKYVQSDNVLC